MIILSNPLLLFLLLTPNVISLSILERGDEGGYGSSWGGVHLVIRDNKPDFLLGVEGGLTPRTCVLKMSQNYYCLNRV